MYESTSEYLSLTLNNLPRNVIRMMLARIRRHAGLQLDTPVPPLLSEIPTIFAPHVDVTRAQVGFGRRAIPSLINRLNSYDKLTLHQAINSLSDAVYDPEKSYYAIKHRLMPRLRNLLKLHDAYVRERCCSILGVLGQQADGNIAIMRDKKLFENLLRCTADPEYAVRYKACYALEAIALYWEAADLMNKVWTVPVILERLSEEDMPDITVINLKTLQLLLARAFNKETLELGGMDVLIKLIHYPNQNELQSNALACLAHLLSHPLGLVQAAERELLLDLVDKLYHVSTDVQNNAAACLSFIAVPTPPKLQIAELGVTDQLLKLAALFPNVELQINSVKVLTNIAETPKGRKYLLNKQQFIEDIKTSGSEKLDRHIETLLEVIRWTP